MNTDHTRVKNIPNGPNGDMIRIVEEPFRKLLKARIKARFPSIRAFVRAAGGFGSEDAGASHVSSILRGKHPIPLARLGSWVQVLFDFEENVDDFWEKAYLADAPDEAREKVQELHEELKSLRSQMEHSIMQAEADERRAQADLLKFKELEAENRRLAQELAKCRKGKLP